MTDTIDYDDKLECGCPRAIALYSDIEAHPDCARHGDPRNVTVRVSAPYTLIAGGWTGMRPVGRRRDYRATVFGDDYQNTSKAEIQRVIRSRFFRETGSHTVRFTFIDEAAPVTTPEPVTAAEELEMTESKSLTVTVYDVITTNPQDGRRYRACYAATADYFDGDENDITPIERTFWVGQAVKVHAFGKFRDGVVTKLGRTKPTVRYERNLSGDLSVKAFPAHDVVPIREWDDHFADFGRLPEVSPGERELEATVVWEDKRQAELDAEQKVDREAEARADVLASMTDVERRLALAWIAGYAPGTFAEGVEAAKRVTGANFEAAEPCGCRSARFRPHGPGHQAGCKADLPSGVDVSDLPTSGETVVEDERGPVPGLTVFEELDDEDDGTPEPTFEADDRVVASERRPLQIGTVTDRNIIGRGPKAPERVAVAWDGRPDLGALWYDAAELTKVDDLDPEFNAAHDDPPGTF